VLFENGNDEGVVDSVEGVVDHDDNMEAENNNKLNKGLDNKGWESINEDNQGANEEGVNMDET
jgi:hypothetical protein